MTLHIHEAGIRNAAAIIFLHGAGLSGRQWQPQFERLAEFHLLAPDLPEHGQSADVRPFVLEDAAQRVAELIRERVPQARAHIVGLSLGGALAIALMHVAPECADHTIVSGTSAGMGRVLGKLMQAGGVMYKLYSPQRLAELSLKQFGIPLAYHDLVRDDLMRSATPAFNDHVTRALMDIRLPPSASGPLLVAVGEKETFVAKSDARKLVATIQGAQGLESAGPRSV